MMEFYDKIKAVATGETPGLFVMSNVELTKMCGDLLESKEIKAQRDDLLATMHRLAHLGNGEKLGNSIGNMIAQEAIAKCETQEQIDYHRACICVNACAGSDEDWLDGYAAGLLMGTRKLPLVDQFKLLKTQRDELMSALNNLIKTAQKMQIELNGAEFYAGCFDCFDEYKKEIDGYSLLIAKCEAQS